MTSIRSVNPPWDSVDADLHRPLGIRGTNQQLWNLSFQRRSQRAHWLLIRINGMTAEELLVRNCFLQTGLKIVSSVSALWYLRRSWGRQINWQSLPQEKPCEVCLDVDSSSKRKKEKEQTEDVVLFKVLAMLECFFTIYSALCAFQFHNFCLLVCEGSNSWSAAFPSNRFLAHPTRCQLQDSGLWQMTRLHNTKLWVCWMFTKFFSSLFQSPLLYFCKENVFIPHHDERELMCD